MLKITQTSGKARHGFIEFQNVSAGVFNPEHWLSGTLNLLHDIRSPLIEPLEGAYRNIYAPSAVELPGSGWRVFYGAWDGTPDGHDRIYSVVTRNFSRFTHRHTVIEHGPFHHICNVNAIRHDDGSYSMVCTAYPDEHGLNKPVFFRSPDGRTWNDTPAPYPATMDDIISMEAYEGFTDADINGMNVILFEDGVYRLYFGNFKDFGQVYRASSSDGKHYTFDGSCLEGWHAVNDVKKFVAGDEAWYLMGLHMNGDTLWYSLSRNGMNFDPVSVLGKNLSDEDRYIVAHGWVVQGSQKKPGRRILGFLYGAGSHQSLTMNRIFARWLQKKVELVLEDGSVISADFSHGPDAQLIPFTTGRQMKAVVKVFAEDGKTLLSQSVPAVFQNEGIYRLYW